MTMDKQKIEQKTYVFLGQIADKIRTIRSGGKIGLFLDKIFYFVMAALLSKGTILGDFSPFALCFAAASCFSGGTFVAAIGAFFGYIILGSDITGLGCAGAALVSIAVYQVMSDTKFVKKRLFMPCVTALTWALTAIPFTELKNLSDILSFLCVMVVTFGTVYFYSFALSKDEEENKNLKLSGIMVLTATVLISVYDVTIFGIIHPSRIVAVIVIMTVSYMSGYSVGSAMGVAMGITMDASGENGMFFSCVYAFSALISGVFNRSGKTIFVCVYVVANATAALLGAENSGYLPVLYESFIASVVFMMIPEGAMLFAKEYLSGPPRMTIDYVRKVRTTAKNYALETSRVFYEMYLTVINSIQKSEAYNDEDIASIYNKTADKVCKKCALCNICWEKEYVSTLNALNDASNNILKNGEFKASDFPLHFSSRCVNFSEFLTVSNESLSALIQRRIYKERINENKSLVAEQYAGITGVLRQIGSFMGTGPEFIPSKEDLLKKYTTAFGKINSAVAFKDQFGRLCMEIGGEAISKIQEDGEGYSSGLSALIGVKLDVPKKISDEFGVRLSIKELEPIKAIIGVGEEIKEGQKISGDSKSFFVSDDGKAYMLLSDGMGSGEGASRDSSAVIDMLERFLKSGIAPLDALKTISPAIKIKTQNVSFITIDIVSINLFTGECEIIKCGSAPSYVYSNGKVRKIKSESLPEGIVYQGSGQDIIKFRLKKGDRLVLMTDGVCDGIDDEWITEILENETRLSVKELAAEIILAAKEKNNDDDMTVMVLKVGENNI